MQDEGDLKGKHVTRYLLTAHRRLRENRDVISKWKAIVNFPEIPVNHSVQTSSYPSWARVMEAGGVAVVVSRLCCHAVTLLNVRGCSNFRWEWLLVRLLLCPRRVSAHNWVLVPDVTTSHEPCLPPPPDHWRAETNTATGQSSASQTYHGTSSGRNEAVSLLRTNDDTSYHSIGNWIQEIAHVFHSLF